MTARGQTPLAIGYLGIVVAAAIYSLASAGAGEGTKAGSSSASVVSSTVPAAANRTRAVATFSQAVGAASPVPAANTPQPPALGNAGLVRTVTAGETAQVLTPDQWALIQAAFPDNPYTMARIAFCESRFQNAIVGEGKYVGWFQIDPAHAPGADLTNPVVNVLVASYLAAINPDLSDWPLTRYGCKEWSR